MKRLLTALAALYALQGTAAPPPEWIIASRDSRLQAGGRIELVVVSLGGQALPEELMLRLKSGLDERIVTLQAAAPARGLQRAYAASLPPGMTGAVEIELIGRASSVLTISVEPRPDAVGTLTGRHDQYEPPLSENDPMYFVVGARDGWSARFQLSFKYRLFDPGSGYGRDRPLLSALYFGYTQNSLWDLDSDSRAFRDTSYMPSFFWKWERTDKGGWIDAARLGLEHESNGNAGDRSRSINIVYVRPEWHWQLREQHELQFTPKIYGYLDRSDNPDIYIYRGYVDWRLRYDAAGEWIATSVTRVGTSGKGSFLLDVSKRARDIRFGPVGGYWHFQFFTGYGESILDYDVRGKTQLRVGFAIVP